MTTQSTWLVWPHPRTKPALRLFCFSYAGGGATVFRPWMRQMASAIEVGAIQLPGREIRLRERPFIRLDSLVEALVPILQPWLDQPFAFFGHSLGALIGFELTRRLRQQNLPLPRMLIASAYSAPDQLHSLSKRPMHTLTDEDFVRELRRFNGTPEAVLANPEMLALVLPTLRADFELTETYVYRPDTPLDLPFAIFHGREDQVVASDELVGWAAHTTARCTFHAFDGDHFFIHSAQASVISTIEECLKT